MPGDLDPPTTYTLAQAIAELKRIGPVYSAATRYADNCMYNPTARANDLIAAVKVARPTVGPTSGTMPIGSNTQLDERTVASWATIAGV